MNTDQSYQTSCAGGNRKGGPSGHQALLVCEKVFCSIRKVAAISRQTASHATRTHHGAKPSNSYHAQLPGQHVDHNLLIRACNIRHDVLGLQKVTIPAKEEHSQMAHTGRRVISAEFRKRFGHGQPKMGAVGCHEGLVSMRQKCTGISSSFMSTCKHTHYGDAVGVLYVINPQGWGSSCSNTNRLCYPTMYLTCGCLWNNHSFISLAASLALCMQLNS